MFRITHFAVAGFVVATLALAPAGTARAQGFAVDGIERLAQPDEGRIDVLAAGADAAPLLARLQAAALRPGAAVFIRIFKAERQLEVWLEAEAGYRRFATYPICRFSGRLGPKLAEGDSQAPEGFYAVTSTALNPDSRFHLSFDLGFPNAYDRGRGRTGSYLMVHGGCVSAGCYAMTDGAITEIYAVVEAALRAGQPAVPVHIFPFRMTAERQAAVADSRWAREWRMLQPGYDRFEADRRPPPVYVCDGRYAFAPGARCTTLEGTPLS